MEKRIPHYSLTEIQAQMTSVMAMNLTESAHTGIHAVGIGWADALAVVQDMQRKIFYKSMTIHRDHRIWRDVYHDRWSRQDVVCQVPAGRNILRHIVQGVVA